VEALQQSGTGELLPSRRWSYWREEEDQVILMVSTLPFIQAILQHSIAASRILARTVSGRGIDMVLIQEPWYHGNCIRGLNIPGYQDTPCTLLGGGTCLGHVS
jgi:hypothetical protein